MALVPVGPIVREPTDPVDPNFCPTCLSGTPNPNEPYEVAIADEPRVSA